MRKIKKQSKRPSKRPSRQSLQKDILVDLLSLENEDQQQAQQNEDRAYIETLELLERQSARQSKKKSKRTITSTYRKKTLITPDKRKIRVSQNIRALKKGFTMQSSSDIIPVYSQLVKKFRQRIIKKLKAEGKATFTLGYGFQFNFGGQKLDRNGYRQRYTVKKISQIDFSLNELFNEVIGRFDDYLLRKNLTSLIFKSLSLEILE